MPELAKNSASSRPPYSFKPSVRESPIKREVLRSTGTEVSAGGKVSAGGASVEDSVTGADPSVGGSAGEDSGEGNFAVGVSVLPLEAALSEMESEDRGMLDGCLSSVSASRSILCSPENVSSSHIRGIRELPFTAIKLPISIIVYQYFFILFTQFLFLSVS